MVTVMDITKDIRPLTEFKRDTANFMSHLKESGRPSILTVNGKPALVVMDADAWQEAQNQLEYAQTVTGIRKGLSQALAGEGREVNDFFASLE